MHSCSASDDGAMWGKATSLPCLMTLNSDRNITWKSSRLLCVEEDGKYFQGMKPKLLTPVLVYSIDAATRGYNTHTGMRAHARAQTQARAISYLNC